MKTKPWNAVTRSDATLDRTPNSRMGIIGNLATFHSTKPNSTAIRHPKTIRQTTVAEFHGFGTPPNSRPSITINVAPKADSDPGQATAARPPLITVRGL